MQFCVIVVLTALVCVAQCRPQPHPTFDNKWKKVFSAQRVDNVRDGDDNPLVYIFGNLTVFGDYNKTQDKAILSNFVSEKLSALEQQPAESIQEINAGRPLPLMFNMTVMEVITTGPSPVKRIGVLLSAEVYAKKKKHDEAISVIQSFKSAF